MRGGAELVDESPEKERFGLFWPGKRDAIRAAQTPTTATLAPDFGESLDWDTTQNVFIEGDNLEVLKILQKHYYGKIKMIYIDPPYNTGKDFVYRDNFRDGIGAYLEMTGQADESGKLSTNSESDGRYHSNWLNMMYPRLKLARNLLREDGVIFISIDDAELASLLKICQEIFGEQNHLATLVWKRMGGRQDSRHYAAVSEYILVFARNSSSVNIIGDAKEDDSYPHLDEVTGVRYKLQLLRKWGANSLRTDRPNLYYPITDPDGNEHFPMNGDREGRWRWSPQRMQEAITAGLVTFRKQDDNWTAYERIDEGEVKLKKKSTLISSVDYSSGAPLVQELFGTAVFDFPKPVDLISKTLSALSSDDTIVLDFFAGSGTTAHAVMQLNAEDGGNRRCISVQLPEVTGEKSEARKAGYSVISQISRERIRRAGAKIRADYAETLKERETPLDTGFRAYRLVDTNFRKWQIRSDADLRQIQDALEDSVDTARDEATPAELLTEVMLKLGLSLSEHVAETRISGLDVFTIGDGLMLAYLNEHHTPTLEQLRALVSEQPVKLVLLEDALKGDDQLKTNLAQECTLHDVELWTV